MKQKSNFDKLVEEGEALLKAMGAGDGAAADGAGDGDEKVREMAAEGGEGGEAAVAAAAADAATDGAAGAADAGAEGDGEDEVLGKSFEVTLPGGEKVKAVDGGALVKSLMAQNETLAKAQGLTNKVLGELQKANKGLTEQNAKLATTVETMQKSLDAIANVGKGRKSVVNLVGGGDKPEGDKAGLQPREFMAKALDAQKAGKITATEVARCEGYIGRGMQVPDDLVRRVVGG